MFSLSLTPPSTMTTAIQMYSHQDIPLFGAARDPKGRNSKGHTVLLLLDLGRLTHRAVHLETSFRLHQVGCKEGVDHGRFAQSSLACKQEGDVCQDDQ
jgi:hypothetical protein